MNVFAQMLSVAIASIFVQNSIFERALGTNILLYAARKKENILGFSIGITFFTTLSSVIAYFIDCALIGNQYYNVIIPFIYVAVVGIIYAVTLIVIFKFFHGFFLSIKKYVHLSALNCSVLGALFLNSQYGNDLASYIGYGLGTGIGFLLAAYLLYAASRRLNSELVPACFRGMPIMIVYVGILSLAFYAFIGYSTTL